MSEYEYSAEEEARDVSARHPHVVILGAGASLAAFPNGDRNGNRLPLMHNLVEVVGLGPTLEQHGVSAALETNFEAIFASLYEDAPSSPAIREIEHRIEQYFSAMQLPDEPTIYDHLVLSLREKDLIATFNWDPFLYQACHRNHRAAPGPDVVYLHGNVAIGFCMEHRKKGSRAARCSHCRQPFTPSRLLYPITNKDYASDPFINAEWKTLQSYLPHAFVLTVFGYGAPASDVAAVALMKSAWGDVEQRALEQTEIVDVKPEAELERNWEPFIHTHHYDIARAFADSWLGKHPRRSIEAAWQQILEAKFIDENRPPPNLNLSELQRWYGQLVQFES